MLKKSEKINTSDTYVKSDNLTEKWKKGELPDGDYYIKRRNGSTLYDNIDSRGVWRNSIDEDIIKVLAQVPSYDGYMTLIRAFNNVVDENTKLKERNDSLNNRDIKLCRIANGIRDENFALKKLLKECVEVLNDAQRNYGYDDSILDICSPIITKINQVLGERIDD